MLEEGTHQRRDDHAGRLHGGCRDYPGLDGLLVEDGLRVTAGLKMQMDCSDVCGKRIDQRLRQAKNDIGKRTKEKMTRKDGT
jgi:hypothetical protein